ncbi:hypothetical protein TNCV_884501 [Trichonephila clavipes]|nr:hypothetical protein TNCV_884501 [Trichonephila clavipes]
MGSLLLFDLGEAPTPRLAVIMAKGGPAPHCNRRSLSKKNPVVSANGGRGRLLWPANEKGRGVWCGPTLVFKIVFLGDERRALDGENLKRALKKRDMDGGGPRLERRDEMNAGGVGELE